MRIETQIFACFLSLTILIPSVFALEIERPSFDVYVGKRVESSSTNGVVSVGLGVDIYKYYENDPGDPAWGNDYLKLRVAATANSRKVITYEAFNVAYRWINVPKPTGIVGDDVGAWIELSRSFRFYGGPWSANYWNVWVSSNGFICFEDSESTSPHPKSIPNPEKPNALIAALWTDLEVDGEASITYDDLVPDFGNTYFIVSWNNVKQKSTGERLTFQLWLEYTGIEPTRGAIQGRIFMSYKSVGSLSYPLTAGIEDHEGLKGTNGLVGKGISVEFRQNSNSAYLKRLKINIEESDPYAIIDISNDPNFLRGYNVQLKSPYSKDDNRIYTEALRGRDALILWKAGFILLEKVSKLVGGILVELQMDLIKLLAHDMESNADVVISDKLSTGGYAELPTIKISTNPDMWVVDAAFGILVCWIFADANTQSHSIEITTTATYAEYDQYGNRVEKSWSTSVDVTVVPDAGNDFASARVVSSLPAQYEAVVGIGIPPPGASDTSDFYKVNVPVNHILKAEMTPPSQSDINFDLHIYKDTILASSSTNTGGIPEYASALIYDGGICYVEVRAQAGYGNYTLRISTEQSSLPPPGGGGTPGEPLSIELLELDPG